MATLLDTYSGFEGVVNHFTKQLKSKIPKLDAEDFKEWMADCPLGIMYKSYLPKT